MMVLFCFYFFYCNIFQNILIPEQFFFCIEACMFISYTVCTVLQFGMVVVARQYTGAM